MKRANSHSLLAACAWLVLSLLLALPQQALAQAGIEAQDVKVTYDFGQRITFQARLQSPAGIQHVSVLFRKSDEEVTRIEAMTLGPDGTVRYTYDASLNVLPPFSNVLFWFQAALADGSTEATPVYYFHYDDNRFPWRAKSEGTLTVHWYEGDAGFGQAALDAARAGVNATSQLLPVTQTAALDVYIYANADDLQGALFLGGKQWVGGHADPELGVAMVSIAPGDTQGIEMQTEIPHEVAHVLLYRDMGKNYARLPAWLSEGIASMVEAYPKPDYANALALASRNGSLIPFTELCTSFPPDSGRAFLAYAQAQSFARYLQATYGSTGLAALLGAYGDGLDCELGAARAVGMPLSQLDARWRESVLKQNVAGVAARTLAPYMIMLGLALLIPAWGLARMALEKRKYERQSI